MPKWKDNVRVGQIWRDYDSRFRNQTPVLKRILKIENGYAYCEGIRNGLVISKTKIRLDRFRPNSTGYKLLKEKS